MAVKRKKKKTINLLPVEAFQSSIIGRVLKWSLTSFRVMVILCELMVLGAFLSRFWLDARISDLNEEINIAKSQVLAYQDVETEFRALQKRLLVTNELYSQKKLSNLIETVNRYIPSDVLLNSVTLIEGSIQIKATSFSEQSIVQFIVNLEATDIFDDVSLSQVASSIENESFVTFTLTTKLK